MLEATNKAIDGGRFPHLKYLNLGGGLGIDYKKHAARTTAPASMKTPGRGVMPTPSDLLAVVGERLARSGLTLVLEPGRSLVGDAAILVTKVIGCKRNGNTNYIVVDGAMTELIRPSLYGAYHHIELTESSRSQVGRDVYSIVGQVCESSDFLGKDRYLPCPHEGAGVAIFDVGAYGSCMASNYNMRCRPAEIMVNGDTWRIIRKPDSLEDILQPFQDLPQQPRN
ncbi:putative diaminopimelate decarboxylase, chloroplastic [Lamellibrachia satsuma]|nr:putative diaminopimelate decarboxylase, chloroplastic [Lamellibrachia satsuma]